MAVEFIHSPALPDRLERMVNNEYFADVVFLVGDEGERIHGHKMILTLASEVFFAQFNGQFEEAQPNSEPITVPDIQPAIFRDILRYMYCQKITLSEETVTDVYYASQKYMLPELNKMCEEFFARNIDDSNVLKVFNDNRKYEFAIVNEKCLATIRDNPLACFEHENFFTLEKKSLEIIAGSTRISCLEKQMQEAIQNWAKVNELQLEDANQLEQIVLDRKRLELDCEKLYNFPSFHYVHNLHTVMDMISAQPVALYGMGIFVKSQWRPLFTVDRKVTLKILVRVDGMAEYSEQRVVSVTNQLRIEECLFKKMTIPANVNFRIAVQFERSLNPLYLFCLKGFLSIDGLITMQNTTFRPYGQTDETNCVAYLLYKLVKTQCAQSKFKRK